MAVLSGRKLSGKPWAVSLPVVSPADALTDIAFVQAAPAHPLMGYQSSIGYFSPIGGIGPFRFLQNGDPLAKYATESNTGRLYGSYNLLGTSSDTVSVTCVDGRGTSVTKTFAIAKKPDSNAAAYFNDRPTVMTAGTGNQQNNPSFHWHLQAFGGTHTQSDTIELHDPSGTFVWFYGVIAPGSLSSPPPAGTYLMTATLTGTGSDVLTISFTVVVQAAAPPVIEFEPAPFSTATPIGTVIGNLRATTPFNSPTWSISDPSGTLLVDQVKGSVAVMHSPVTGDLPVIFTVNDNGAIGSLDRVLTVAPGTILAPSAMSMTVATGLINAGTGQVIGTPAVVGQSGGNWRCVDHTGFNPNAELGYYGCPRRIVQDPASGQITAPGMLSAETIQLEVAWISADGLTSCVRTFPVTVAPAPEVVYYVGQGASTTYGANGFETLAAARTFNFNNRNRATTFRFKVFASADPNYYSGLNLCNDYSQGWAGPIHIEGIAANGVAQPRTGGPVGAAQGGGDYYGKGPFVFQNGDAVFENMEVSFVNGSGLTDGLEAVRKDGQTYGNLTLLNCNIHDCNNGLETGVCHGNITVTDCEFANCGTSHTSAGNDHNLYVGSVSSLSVTGTVSRRATLGHMLKSRAKVTNISNSAFLATTGGQEGVPIELPNAGVATITNCLIQKAVLGQNPHSILFCAERDFGVPGALAIDEFPWVENSLTVNQCQIDVMMMGGSHLGQPTGVAYYRCQDPFGRWMPPPVVSNTSMWLATGGSRTWTMVGLGNQTPDTTPEHQVIETGGSTRALPFVPPTARPFLPGTLPVMGAFRWSGQWGGDSYQNFDSGQHVQSANDLRISSIAPAGTVLMTLSATNGAYNQLSTSNPFVAGTTWSLPITGIYYPTEPHDPFAPANAFGITTHPDGTATLTVGTGLSAGTVYYVQARATAPTNVLADYRYAVVVSS